MKYTKKKKSFKDLTLKQITLLAVVYRLEKHLSIPVTVATITEEMQRLDLLPKDLVGAKEGIRTRIYQIQFKKKLLNSRPTWRVPHSVGGTQKEFSLPPEGYQIVKEFVQVGVS